MNVKVRLVREYTFEAAHRLPQVPAGHKCERLHGHSFRVEVAVEGKVDERTGWFIDYGRLDELWEPIDQALDHRYLNDVEGLENPTSEILARWIWRRLESDLPLARITIFETCDSRCEYEGD